MRSWYAEFVAGRCNDVQARYWKPKPPEEFYLVADDPFEVRNLIAQPRYAEHIARLRAALALRDPRHARHGLHTGRNVPGTRR